MLEEEYLILMLVQAADKVGEGNDVSLDTFVITIHVWLGRGLDPLTKVTLVW